MYRSCARLYNKSGNIRFGDTRHCKRSMTCLESWNISLKSVISFVYIVSYDKCSKCFDSFHFIFVILILVLYIRNHWLCDFLFCMITICYSYYYALSISKYTFFQTISKLSISTRYIFNLLITFLLYILWNTRYHECFS